MSLKGVSSGFWSTSLSLFGRYTRHIDPFLADLREELPRAGIKVPLPAYLAGSILASSAAAFAGAVAGLLGALAVIGPSALVGAAVLGSGSMAFVISLSVFYFAPTVMKSARRHRLESELPFAVGQLSVLSTSGMTPENLFHALAEERGAGVVNDEAKLVVRDMSAFGMDLSSALRAAVNRSPSKVFSEFLDGFLSASATGANLSAYLTRAASSLMLDRRIKAKAVGETVGVAGEVYTILLVVAPLMLIIMFSLIGTIVGSLGGLNVLSLMYFVAYFIVPVGGVVALIVADTATGGSK